MSDYAFEGDTIKINKKDYDKMQRLYSNLHLMAELEQLDFELTGTKKWWPVMNAKLNYRNKVAAQRNTYGERNIRDIAMAEKLTDRSWAKRSTRDITLEEELSDKSWAH